MGNSLPMVVGSGRRVLSQGPFGRRASPILGRWNPAPPTGLACRA